MKRILIEGIDQPYQPLSKRRKPIPAKKDLNEVIRELGQHERWKEAKNIINYQKEEDQEPLVFALLEGLTIKPCIQAASSCLQTLPKDDSEKFVRYFFRQLIINSHFESVITWFKQHPDSDSQRKQYLTELARLGMLDEGLHSIDHIIGKEYRRSLKVHLLTELLINGYPGYVQEHTYWYTKNDFFKLTRDCIISLIQKGFPDEAIMLVWYEYSAIKPYRKSDLSEAMISTLVTHNYCQQAINLIKPSRNNDQLSLLKIYIREIQHDIFDETANLKLMFFINFKPLNRLFADAICTEEAKLDGDALLAKANKIISIKRRYKIENFDQAKAISDLSEVSRTLILCRDSFFYQKNIAAESMHQIIKHVLHLSEEDTEGVIEAVRRRGPVPTY